MITFNPGCLNEPTTSLKFHRHFQVLRAPSWTDLQAFKENRKNRDKKILNGAIFQRFHEHLSLPQLIDHTESNFSNNFPLLHLLNQSNLLNMSIDQLKDTDAA